MTYDFLFHSLCCRNIFPKPGLSIGVHRMTILLKCFSSILKETASLSVQLSSPISIQNCHALVNALEKVSVHCNEHDTKILPPSVHSHHEGTVFTVASQAAFLFS